MSSLLGPDGQPLKAAQTEAEAYEDLIEAAVFTAIMEASVVDTDEGPRPVVRAFNVASALIRVLGGVLATTEASATLAGMRKIVDTYAKELRMSINDVRREIAAEEERQRAGNA